MLIAVKYRRPVGQNRLLAISEKSCRHRTAAPGIRTIFEEDGLQDDIAKNELSANFWNYSCSNKSIAGDLSP